MSNQKNANSPPSRAAVAEAHYRRIFEAVPVGISALSSAGEFTELNPAAERILGRPAADLIGRHFSEVLPPEELPSFRELDQRLSRGETGMVDAELHVLRPGGERQLVHVRMSSISEEGRVVAMQGVASDLAEERAREREAHRSERLASISTLLSGVAHELNNPLNAIRNFAQLMLLDPRSDDDREALEIMRDQADRAARIVADVRGITRQTGGADSNLPVDLNELVRRTVQLQREAIGAREITVSLRLADDLPRVQANPAELEQALLSLLTNAEEAIGGEPRGRRIEIRTERAGERVQVEIEDTGRGIPAEHLGRVFDPFWTTKAPGEGAGLGLSLVHRILSDQGGGVRVRSEPGAGAVFTLDLTPVQAAEPTPEQLPLIPPSRTLRVLVVDDDLSVRESIVRYLRRRGHTVEEAGDGVAALEMISRRQEYDVILTDLRMPEMGGEELISRLREDGTGLERAVVVITGHADDAERDRIRSSTGVPILVKPASLEEIAATVERRAEQSTDRGREDE